MSSVTNLLEQLRETFLDGMLARVQKMESGVMSSNTDASYDELFRMVHSVKGTAGSYSFYDLTKIAHGMEDVMLHYMERGEFGSSTAITVLLKFIDVFRDTTESLIETKVTPVDLDERLELLRSLVFKERINVLVVEPSALYAKLIEYSLGDLVANITFQDDGLAALDSLLLNKYDLLITSLECPRLNGDALTAALRLLHNFNKNIKVILLTSHDPDKIENKQHFDAIWDKKIIKSEKFSKMVETILNN